MGNFWDFGLKPVNGPSIVKTREQAHDRISDYLDRKDLETTGTATNGGLGCYWSMHSQWYSAESPKSVAHCTSQGKVAVITNGG